MVSEDALVAAPGFRLSTRVRQWKTIVPIIVVPTSTGSMMFVVGGLTRKTWRYRLGGLMRKQCQRCPLLRGQALLSGVSSKFSLVGKLLQHSQKSKVKHMKSSSWCSVLLNMYLGKLLGFSRQQMEQQALQQVCRVFLCVEISKYWSHSPSVSNVFFGDHPCQIVSQVQHEAVCS